MSINWFLGADLYFGIVLAWAAITEHHMLGGLKNGSLFLVVLVKSSLTKVCLYHGNTFTYILIYDFNLVSCEFNRIREDFLGLLMRKPRFKRMKSFSLDSHR